MTVTFLSEERSNGEEVITTKQPLRHTGHARAAPLCAAEESPASGDGGSPGSGRSWHAERNRRRVG